MAEKKFVAAFDLHYGYERDKHRHKKPLHDPWAMDILLQFISDYKPDEIVLGGDMLDCGAVSHHNKNKPGKTEGLRVRTDAEELQDNFLAPIESAVSPDSNLTYLIGNHEDWLDQLLDELPMLAGLIELENILNLQKWKVVPRGGIHHLGKLSFVHGDKVTGGEHVAKAAVIAYERSIRFGHHHTYQAYTKNTAWDISHMKTGVAIPCLCTRDPKYGQGRPNRWTQGFNYGVIHSDGTYNDQVPIIVGKKSYIEGKVYRG